MKRPVAVRRVIPPNRSARRAGICGVALALAAMPAVADDLVPADPWEVIHVAREFGPAEVGRDSLKDPQIVAATEGLNYRIDFYGCRLGRDCDTILFEARFARKAWKEETPPGGFSTAGTAKRCSAGRGGTARTGRCSTGP